jgi:signal transduction histidine kinase
MKLFPKLALTVSALLMGTTACLSLSFYLAEQCAIRTEADQERHALLQNLVHIAQESFLTNDDLLLVKYTRWIQKWNPSLVSASVVSPEGEVLAHSEPSQIGKSVSQPRADPGGTEVLVLTQPIRLGNQWIATASAGFSERQFEETVQNRLHELQKRLGLIAAGAVGAGLIISFLLALSWTRLIASLEQAARRVGEGKYDLDLAATSRRRDELGFLSKAFQTMAVQLQQLDQMKDDFVSAVTHELRSPLSAIESYLNLIHDELREGISPSAWQDFLERMSLNTQRLSHFVNDLLDVAALERGKITLEKSPVNLAILMQDVAALYAAKLSERRISLKTSIPSKAVPEVLADPDKIHHVLVNLLSNAIKFTSDHGTIEMGLENLPQEKQVRVYVKDSGVGISEENQAKIFNKFEQVRAARQNVKGPKGTGLGLSICRSLIELHNGTIGVASKLNEGSLFHFELPLVSVRADSGPLRHIQGDLV